MYANVIFLFCYQHSESLNLHAKDNKCCKFSPLTFYILVFPTFFLPTLNIYLSALRTTVSSCFRFYVQNFFYKDVKMFNKAKLKVNKEGEKSYE